MKRTSKKNRCGNAGFTLLEIMMVVGIIVVLMGVAIVKMGHNVDIAKEVRVKSDLQSITMQLNMYNTLNGFYPSTEQGLQALVTPPETDPKPLNWHLLLDSLPLDPWQKPYVYVYPGKHNTESFDLYSCGPDHTPDTADDIGNWQK